ncbi:response regulator [Enterococcus alishanensis]|uniref:Transcriptional regulatory protein n=1 Tax=Enterococcus alishanensis TaxID=1303817 RepID=A0ABS6T924_9ENTE|nr:response regulator [Enterococcus alishanensis]MBV7389393.1 response regulator [Enterococcus alishanensis]
MTTILILEDDPMVAFIHQSYLTKIDSQLNILEATSTDDAKALLAEEQIDLILLDLHLKHDDGLAFLRDLRQQEFPGEVILITAENQTEALKAAHHLGILDYLMKPFSYERFAQSFESFLAKTTMLQHEELNQAQIDQLFYDKSQKKAELILEKGLSKATLARIYKTMQEFPASFTVAELAEKSGFSHVSVRKYMQFLEQQDLLTSDVIYRKQGRPFQTYQIKNPALWQKYFPK